MLKRHWAFFLSCLFAFTAGHIVNYSVIMYAQEMLHSDLLAGIGFGLCFGPPLILGWYAGVLCDRKSAANIIHFAQGAFVLAALVLWAGHSGVAAGAHLPPGAPLLAGAFLAGVGWSFAAPARMTVLGQIMTPSELKPASLIFNLLVMMGFGLGPIVISACRTASGWPAAFGAAGTLATVASLLLLRINAHPTPKPPRSVLADVAEGFAAARANPLLAQLLVAAIFGYMLMGPIQVLLPKLARTELGLTELQRGAFLGTLAPSLIFGGLLCLAIAARVSNGKTIFAASGLAGLLFALLGNTHRADLAVVLLACIGTVGGVAVSLIVAGIQANVAESVRGRVNSMYTIISQVLPAASGVAGGLLAHRYGVRQAAMLWGGFLLVAAVVNAGWMGSLRRYRGDEKGTGELASR